MFVNIRERSSNSPLDPGRFVKLLSGWPIAVVLLALGFTVLWIGFLCWLVLRVLHLI